LSGAFVPGLNLGRAFYEEIVAELLGLRRSFGSFARGRLGDPRLRHSRSTDHGWGQRLQIFVADDETAHQLQQRIQSGIPNDFRGWPTRFGWDDRPVVHHVEVAPLGSWLEEQLGLDPREGSRTETG